MARKPLVPPKAGKPASPWTKAGKLQLCILLI